MSGTDIVRVYARAQYRHRVRLYVPRACYPMPGTQIGYSTMSCALGCTDAAIPAAFSSKAGGAIEAGGGGHDSLLRRAARQVRTLNVTGNVTVVVT
eukprot:591597-Rhodomonas_salina.1